MKAHFSALAPIEFQPALAEGKRDLNSNEITVKTAVAKQSAGRVRKRGWEGTDFKLQITASLPTMAGADVEGRTVWCGVVDGPDTAVADAAPRGSSQPPLGRV